MMRAVAPASSWARSTYVSPGLTNRVSARVWDWMSGDAAKAKVLSTLNRPPSAGARTSWGLANSAAVAVVTSSQTVTSLMITPTGSGTSAEKKSRAFGGYTPLFDGWAMRPLDEKSGKNAYRLSVT